MTDAEQKFIRLRADGWSYARLAPELSVSKTTLVEWSRHHRQAIQNLRAINMEALRERVLTDPAGRVQYLGEKLAKLEGELAKRDLNKVPTATIYALIERVQREIERLTGSIKFSISRSELGAAEPIRDEVKEWTP